MFKLKIKTKRFKINNLKYKLIRSMKALSLNEINYYRLYKTARYYIFQD